ncbi:hypothetical protein DPMN_102282 [Dreissena polymorpha]|uniref:Uncharacterized protein n=1 Tax=Dreissena polymorpha TaxID=45954 RepID=A0A9D4LL51_DREPO|nr:hypothetical protein DPMN_102282 [Dreissena polymorpha]
MHCAMYMLINVYYFRKGFIVEHHPKWVLDKLEEIGFRVVSSALNEKMMVWTMLRPQ